MLYNNTNTDTNTNTNTEANNNTNTWCRYAWSNWRHAKVLEDSIYLTFLCQGCIVLRTVPVCSTTLCTLTSSLVIAGLRFKVVEIESM